MLTHLDGSANPATYDDELSAAIEAIRAAFKRWLEAPSFKKGLEYRLGLRAKREELCGQLLVGSPKTLAAVMDRIRPGRLTVELKRRKLPVEMTVDQACHMQATLTASELADLIEQALEDQRPNETNLAKAFDYLWRVEVEGYKPPDAAGWKTPDAKDDRVIRGAQKARRLLGQSRKRGRPLGSKLKDRKR